MPGKKGLFKLKKSTSAPNVSLEWSKHDEKLLHEVEQAHREKVESLINKKGLNPTKLNTQGRSAFHEAATRGQNGILDICIKHCADVQAADAQGRTALHLAARHGRNETLVKLIKAGIPVSVVDLCQMMPIHHACLGGHLPCVNSLISKDSPLNPEDKDKRTPLFFAAEMGEAIVCRELIDNGVNINAQDFRQMTSLMCAAQQGHTDVVDLFVKRGANVRLTDSQGHTASWYALEEGHTEVKQIIDEAPVMAAWDVCAPEEPEKQDERQEAPEVQENVNVSLPDDTERVDFIAHFTVDSSPSPVASKRSQGVANLGEVILTDDENAPSSHESYLEIARKPDTDSTSESVKLSHDITKAYEELVEDNEALLEEFNNVKRELKKVQNKNGELQRRLENRSPPPTVMDTAVVEALEKEISELQKKLQRTKVRKLAEGGESQQKEDLDDSWNDSEDEQDFSGSYDKPASFSENVVDKQLVPMLRSQILTLQKENDKLKHKIMKIPNGDLDGSSDEEEVSVGMKLDVNILNGDKVTSLSHQDILVLNERIQELEKTNKQYLRQIKDLQESSNNNMDINFGAEISGVPGSVVEGLKIEELKIKNEGLKDLNEALQNTTDDLKHKNDRLKVEFDSANRERELFREQLQEIAKFGNSEEEEEGTDVLKFFHEINNLKRENTELNVRNDQLEEEIEQLLKQRTADHKVQGVLPDESVGPQESVVEEVIFGVHAGNVESGVSLEASPYESHWAAGARSQKIDSLQRDNEELQVRIKELTDQKMELESNAEDMVDEISRNEAHTVELQNMNKHFEKECSSVKKLCENLELENNQFRAVIGEKEAKESEIKELEEECEKIQDSHEAMTFVLDETKRHVEILAKENEEYKAKVAALEAENISTCESLKSEALEEIERLSNHIDILQKEKETYQEQLDEFDRKLRKKDNRISSLVQTIEELKRGSSMLHSSKNDVEDQMGGMRREIETLKYENEELEKTVARLMKRGPEEESIKLSIAKSTSSVPADDATVLELEKEVERLKKKVKKLEDYKKEYEEEMVEFAETNQSNFDQCTQLCEELSTLKEQYDFVVDQKTTLEEHFQQSEEERESLQEEISIKRKSIKELKAQCQELTVQNEELTGAVGNLREECLQLEADKDKLSQEIQTLRANLDVVSASEHVALSAAPNLDGAVRVAKHDKEFSEDVHQLREECSDLMQINSELRVRAQSVTKVQEELFELQEDNDRLIEEVEKSKKEMTALLLENQALKEKCDILEQNPVSSSEEENMETEKSELQQDVQNLQDKIVILSHEMNLLTKSNAKLTGECEGYLQQTACLKDERDIAVKEREKILQLNETLRSQVEDLEKENLELEKERLKLSDYEKLKESMSALKEEKSALQVQVEELKHLEIETTQLNIDLCELKSAQVKSDRKVKDLSTQNDELRTEVVQLSQITNSRIPEEQTSQQVKQAVQDAENKIKKLQDEVKRLKKHIKEAEMKHREVVATYRTHLLSAAQGNLNQDVQEALNTIQQIRRS